MTIRKHRKNTSVLPERTVPAGQLLFGIFTVFCLVLILRNSDAAIAYMNRGLRLCAATVIPSLFPFMVISELILSLGIGRILVKPIAGVFRLLFRVSEDGACCMLLGALCGFPIGARCAMTALDGGRMTTEEAERILATSGNPSTAFLINAVGISLWGNRGFGLALYGIVILSQLLTGILLAYFPQKRSDTSFEASQEVAPVTRKKGASVFTDAVRSSCFGMLLVCAYVIFFSTLGGTLECVMNAWQLPSFARSLLFALLELSSGVSEASALANPHTAALLCAFAVGWSGISVHCQLLSVCEGKGLHFRRYFASKLLQGFLCILLLQILLLQFPSLLVPAQATGTLLPIELLPLPLSTFLFLIALGVSLVRKKG